MSETTTILQRARFAWDSTEDDPDAIFTGYHDPSRRWNGWATPAFERAEADRLMAWQTAHGGAGDEQITFDPEHDRYILDSGVLEASTGATYKSHEPGFDAETADGPKHLYAIGAFAWTWDEVPTATAGDPACWCGAPIEATLKTYLMWTDGGWAETGLGGSWHLYCSDDHELAEDAQPRGQEWTPEEIAALVPASHARYRQVSV